MKRNNLLPTEWLQKWACREMTQREIELLRIQDRDDYEYYVCENWLKYLTNYISYDQIERELQNAINVEFEIKIATKQNQSIKKYKRPIVNYNLEKGQRADIRSTLRSGMARYKAVSFEKTIKRISSRKINPFCSWKYRDSAKEKIYACYQHKTIVKEFYKLCRLCEIQALQKMQLFGLSTSTLICSKQTKNFIYHQPQFSALIACLLIKTERDRTNALISNKLVALSII